MSRALVDSSVLIDIWRRGEIAWPELKSNLTYISTVSYIEVLQGAHVRQKAATLEMLNRYRHLRIYEATCDLAIELIEEHSGRDGLRLADSFIAASCLVHSLPLLTLNRRHFQNIDGLELI